EACGNRDGIGQVTVLGLVPSAGRRARDGQPCQDSHQSNQKPLHGKPLAARQPSRRSALETPAKPLFSKWQFQKENAIPDRAILIVIFQSVIICSHPAESEANFLVLRRLQFLWRELIIHSSAQGLTRFQ